MIDLSSNINPFYPTKNMYLYLHRNLNKIKKYSNKHIDVSDDGVLNKYNLKNDNVLVTSGTLGAMDLILRTNTGKNIGLFNPTFWGIREIAKINNNSINEKRLKVNSRYNLNDIDTLSSESDLLYLCNCNNPTLNYIEKEELIKIIRKNKNCLFIIDETVLIFDEQYDNKTLLKHVNEIQNLIVLVSLSKIIGICGLRIGLLITSASQRNKYLKKQVPYSNNVLSSVFLEKYFKKVFELDNCKAKIRSNFNYLINNIDMSLINKIIYNSSSFLLIELKDIVDYTDLVEFILKNQVKVSAINDYYKNLDKKYLRISAGTKSEYKKLIKIFIKYKNSILKEGR